MYTLDEKIMQAFNADSREIYVKAVFNNNYTVDGSHIKSFTITNSVGSTETLSLGNTCSSKLELDMFVPEQEFTGLSAAKIEVSIGIKADAEVAYVPLGIFFADDVRSTDNFKSVKITAFDTMLKLSDLGNTYKCGVKTDYVTPVNIIKDIASQAGVAVNIQKENCVNNTPIANPRTVDFSARTMLGYMAGRLGCNAVINREGVLTLQRLSTEGTFSIPARQQFMNGFEKALENPLCIKYLTTGAETNSNGVGGVITVGQGSYGFNFENPYITSETEAQRILDIYKDIFITPGKVKHKGNPCIDCGDMVTVTDVNGITQNVLVLNQTLSVSGGFNAVIDSSLKTDSKADFITTPSTKRVTQRFNEFNKMYADIISKLTGQGGGYVKKVYDQLNNIRALAICKNDIGVEWDETNRKVVVSDLSDAGEPMWVWSYGGLSFTKNGGSSYEVAINMDGQIFANYLQSPLGFIGGWILNEEKIFQRVVDGDKTYEFTLKSDKSTSGTKKAIYCNIFTDGRNSDSADADNYKTESFYIRRNGEVMFASGEIAGWNIDEKGFYADCGEYRTYMQKPTTADSWILSTQKKDGTDYRGNFYVTQGGDVRCQNLYTTPGKYIYSGWYDNGEPQILIGRSLNSVTAVSNTNMGDTNIYSGTKIRLAIGAYSNCVTFSSCEVDNEPYIDVDGLPLYFRRNIQLGNSLFLSFGASSGSMPLYVNSNCAVVTSSSSERYKENITEEIDDVLNPERLYNLPVVQYNYKEEYKDNELVAGTQIGVTAENVHEYYPNACIYNVEGQPESWQDRIMIPAMLKLIQEQKKQIDNLEQRVKILEKRI